MAHLKICTLSNQINPSCIEIQIIDEGEVSSKVIDFSVTSNLKSFSAELSWYYKDYLFNPYAKHYKRAQIIGKSIYEEGKLLGKKLFDDDFFLKLRSGDPKEIMVTIGSNEVGFFGIPWEMMILPGSTQPLAVCAKDFVRTNINERGPQKYYHLNDINPLHILFVGPRPNEYDCACLSNPVTIFNQLLEYGQSIEVEVLMNCTKKALEERLLQKDKPVHILHFNGYANVTKNGEITHHLLFEDEHGMADDYDVEQLGILLGKCGVDTILIEASDILVKDEEDVISPGWALSIIDGGVRNVVTSTYKLLPCSGERLYPVLYSFIAGGKSIAEAVVATRQVLKEHSKQTIITAQELEFADWPLIVHYSLGDTLFFDEVAQQTPLFQSKKYTGIMGNVLGFQTEFLNPTVFIGRSNEKRKINKIFSQDNVLLLKGVTGIGKTHFTHQFAYCYILEKRGEKAFYFNFETGVLTEGQLVQIIGEVLDGNGADPQHTLEKIENQKFLFVFDNYNARSISSDRNDSFFKFIGLISKGNSKAIITTREEKLIFNSPLKELGLTGLNTYDRRQLAASILKENKKEEEETYSGYYELVDRLQGHPYFTQVLLSYLGDINCDNLRTGIENILQKMVKDAGIFSNMSILALFEYGWDTIPKDHQLVLLAFAKLKGYITDGLPIAVGIENIEHSPGKELFELLSIKKMNVAEAFDKGCKAGLYQKKQFGYEVNPSTTDYLALKIKELNWQSGQFKNLGHITDKIYSIELRVIASFLAQNPNPVLYQKIVENHERWFNALEFLWNSGDYPYYLNGKYFLASILNKVGMNSEVGTWNLKLIKTLGTIKFTENNAKDASIAWLKTANDAMEDHRAIKEDVILTGVAYWDDCLKIDKIVDLEVYNNALMFLESFYRKNKNWEARKALGENSIRFYSKAQLYEQVVTAMRSLARSEEALGNIEQCKAIEEGILNDIPYEKTSEGTKQSAMLDVALSRLQRKEHAEAHDLIEQVKQTTDVKQILIAAENLEGEIFYCQERFEEATACYARIWQRIMKGDQFNHQKIAKRLEEMAEKLDKVKYAEIFKREAPGVKLPVPN
jgi:tetratricopeptide (TPR) repeat protein